MASQLKIGTRPPPAGTAPVNFKLTLEMLGISEPSAEVVKAAGWEKWKRKWNVLANEKIKNSSPLELDAFASHGTEEEKNAFSYVIATEQLAKVPLSDFSVQQRYQSIYDKVVAGLAKGHGAPNLANGRIVALEGMPSFPLGVLPNGSVVADGRFLIMADQAARAVMAALAEGRAEDGVDYDSYVQDALFHSKTFNLTNAQKVKAAEMADGIIGFVISHELVQAAQRGHDKATAAIIPQDIPGFSKMGGKNLSEYQKDELFSDLFGADLAIRAGAPPESILAAALILKALNKSKVTIEHPTTNDRYYFLHQWITRMAKLKMRQFRKDGAPIELGPYIQEGGMEMVKRFPKPTRGPGPTEMEFLAALVKYLKWDEKWSPQEKNKQSPLNPWKLGTFNKKSGFSLKLRQSSK